MFMYSFFNYEVRRTFPFLSASLPPFSLPALLAKYTVCLPKETQLFSLSTNNDAAVFGHYHGG